MFFSQENTPKATQRPTKVLFSPYKQVNGRNSDHEWRLRMTNGFILCDLLYKVQKSHASNREDSFNKLCSSSSSGLFPKFLSYWALLALSPHDPILYLNIIVLLSIETCCINTLIDNI